MSFDRIKSSAGWVNPRALPKGPNGKNLCRQCGIEVSGRRQTFCSDECVDNWRITTSPAFVREKLLRRDHGICCQCGFDAEMIQRRLKSLIRHKPQNYQIILSLYGIVQTMWSWKPNPFESLWQAHHIIPVAKGGGECDLGNYETLCLWCHRCRHKK